MSAVIMDSGKTRFLDVLTGLSTAGLSGAKFHLYTNNVTPSHADVLATYTEATWAGYSAQTAGAWSGATLDGTFHGTSSQANPMGFMNTSGVTQTCYGYYVTDGAGLALLMAERFAGAPLNILNGQSLSLTPNVKDTSEF